MVRVVRDRYAYAVVVVAWTLAGSRALGRRIRPEAAIVSESVARQMYLEVTDREAEDRRSAALRFQGSAWSQQDEFHAKEKGTMRYVANLHRMSISSVLGAVDQGMRERWPTHANAAVSQEVIPCRPRLAY